MNVQHLLVDLNETHVVNKSIGSTFLEILIKLSQNDEGTSTHMDWFLEAFAKNYSNSLLMMSKLLITNIDAGW